MYASFQNYIKSGLPHQRTIGCFDLRQMLTAVSRLCGHSLGGPTAVVDQSIALVRSPISPPPARNERPAARFMTTARRGKMVRKMRIDQSNAHLHRTTMN